MIPQIDKIDQLTMLRNKSKEEYEKYLEECKKSIKDIISVEIKARTEIEEENSVKQREKAKRILCAG